MKDKILQLIEKMEEKAKSYGNLAKNHQKEGNIASYYYFDGRLTQTELHIIHLQNLIRQKCQACEKLVANAGTRRAENLDKIADLIKKHEIERVLLRSDLIVFPTDSVEYRICRAKHYLVIAIIDELRSLLEEIQ